MEVLGTICCLCDHNWQRTPLDHFWQTHAQVCTFQMTPKTQRTGLLMKFRYPHLFKVWHLCLHEFPGQGSNCFYHLSPIWEFRWISTGADSYVINGTFLYNQLATDYRSDMALTKHLFRWLKSYLRRHPFLSDLHPVPYIVLTNRRYLSRCISTQIKWANTPQWVNLLSMVVWKH